MAHSSNTIFSYRAFILLVQVWIRFVASLIFILRIVVQYSPWLKQVSGHRRKLSQQATVRGPQSTVQDQQKSETSIVWNGDNRLKLSKHFQSYLRTGQQSYNSAPVRHPN